MSSWEGSDPEVEGRPIGEEQCSKPTSGNGDGQNRAVGRGERRREGTSKAEILYTVQRSRLISVSGNRWIWSLRREQCTFHQTLTHLNLRTIFESHRVSIPPIQRSLCHDGVNLQQAVLDESHWVQPFSTGRAYEIATRLGQTTAISQTTHDVKTAVRGRFDQASSTVCWGRSYRMGRKRTPLKRGLGL